MLHFIDLQKIPKEFLKNTVAENTNVKQIVMSTQHNVNSDIEEGNIIIYDEE